MYNIKEIFYFLSCCFNDWNLPNLVPEDNNGIFLSVVRSELTQEDVPQRPRSMCTQIGATSFETPLSRECLDADSTSPLSTEVFDAIFASLHNDNNINGFLPVATIEDIGTPAGLINIVHV